MYFLLSNLSTHYIKATHVDQKTPILRYLFVLHHKLCILALETIMAVPFRYNFRHILSLWKHVFGVFTIIIVYSLFSLLYCTVPVSLPKNWEPIPPGNAFLAVRISIASKEYEEVDNNIKKTARTTITEILKVLCLLSRILSHLDSFEWQWVR